MLKRVALHSIVLFVLITSAALELRGQEAAACDNWLTSDEVSAALGVEVDTSEPVEYSPGFTVCSWTKNRPEGQLGANFSFFTPQAIREGMISAESIPEYFDLQVSSHRDTTSVEPEKLDGVGKRAVLFAEDGLWIVMIELEEGFGHLALSPGDVTREQVLAVARGVRSHARE